MLTTNLLVLASALLTSASRHPTKHQALPLEAQVGTHVIYSWSGLDAPDELFTLTAAGKVGGIILFGGNVGPNTTTIVSLLQATYKASPHALPNTPLLIMTDQEGKFVRRLPGGPALSAREISDSENPALESANAGKDVFNAFEPYGANANLAPVLDIFRENGNFIDSKGRSFGNTSERVVECAVPFLDTQQALGVLGTAKHFPGLGAAVAGDNTDVLPVTIDLDLHTLRSVDMAPYVDMIAAGVKMVMGSWALYPSLDKKWPAGLSKKWIQGELRGRLGFKGVTITDAIEAGSLTAFGTQGEIAVLASAVGMDIILASGQNATLGAQATEALIAAVKNGKLPRREFDAATQRIIAMRQETYVEY